MQVNIRNYSAITCYSYTTIDSKKKFQLGIDGENFQTLMLYMFKLLVINNNNMFSDDKNFKTALMILWNQNNKALFLIWL